MFKPATREQNKLRMALDGPAGSGKTYTALRLGSALIPMCPEKVAVIDTEKGSSKLYVGLSPDGTPWNFSICEPKHFAPSGYEQIIQEAARQGFDLLIIDSLSHAWTGAGGALDQVDRAQGNNSFNAWREVTPQHNAMIDAILSYPGHVIVTLRSKMEYVVEKDEKGKTVIRKVGLKPIQREGVEYEFAIVGDMDVNHTLTISKTRCSLIDGKAVHKPGPEFMGPIKRWLLEGEPVRPLVAAVPPPGNGVILSSIAPRCTEDSKAQIIQLAQSLGWEPDKLREVLGRQGVQRFADLAEEDAQSLRLAMQDKLLKTETERTF